MGKRGRLQRAQRNRDRAARGLPPIRDGSGKGRAAVDPSGYAEYIRSPQWREVRRRFIASKIPKVCRGCGRSWGKGDHLHHRTYKNLGWERLMDLVPLCQGCHRRVHDFNNSIPLARRKGLWYATRAITRKWDKKIGQEYPRARQEKRSPFWEAESGSDS